MKRATSGKILVGVFLVVCVGAIAVGLGVIDSPWVAREKKFDMRRSDDLRALSQYIDEYWAKNGYVPETLGEIEPDVTNLSTDPVTGEPYDYRVLAADRYEICATFLYERTCDCVVDFDLENFYFHGPGRQCFQQTVPADQVE